MLPFSYLLSTCCVAAQGLTDDADFFRERAQVYQQWLDHAGFGPYLKVEDVDVAEEALALYLSFERQDIDYAVSAWKALQDSFERRAPVSLEEQLFYKAANLMEVGQEQLSVQLYDTYDPAKDPLFQRAIYFDTATGRVGVERVDPKSPIRPIRLLPEGVDGGKPLSVADFQAKIGRREVYDCIVDYARRRYAAAGLDGKLPEVRVLEEDDNLRFEVIDLRREVLQDGDISDWLRALGLDVEWAKRELLTFLFVYEPTLEGVRISGDIDGKVGSGFYASVRRGAYLPMEIDYDAELASYIDALTVEIGNYLRECQR